MRHVLTLVAIGVAATVGGCASPSSAPAKPIPSGPIQVIVRSDASAANLNARVGQEITVSLPGTAGTGYEWEIGSSSGVTLLGMSSDPDLDGVVGGAERSVLHISCPQPGAYTVPFIYRRPWETGSPPARTYTLTINAVQ